MEKAYKNLGYFFILIIPLTIAAFSKTYINQFPHFQDNITIFIHIHAIISSVWIITLIAQPLFIRYHKLLWHRRVGRLSYVIFPSLILSFIPQMVRVWQSDHRQFVFFPLADSILMATFYSLAIYNRGRPAIHMRYMIGTAVVLLGPTIGRIGPILLGLSEFFTQNMMYAIIYLLMGGLLVVDRIHGKNYRTYLIIMSGYGLHHAAYLTIF